MFWKKEGYEMVIDAHTHTFPEKIADGVIVGHAPSRVFLQIQSCAKFGIQAAWKIGFAQSQSGVILQSCIAR